MSLMTLVISLILPIAWLSSVITVLDDSTVSTMRRVASMLLAILPLPSSTMDWVCVEASTTLCAPEEISVTATLICSIAALTCITRSDCVSARLVTRSVSLDKSADEAATLSAACFTPLMMLRNWVTVRLIESAIEPNSSFCGICAWTPKLPCATSCSTRFSMPILRFNIVTSRITKASSKTKLTPPTMRERVVSFFPKARFFS